MDMTTHTGRNAWPTSQGSQLCCVCNSAQLMDSQCLNSILNVSFESCHFLFSYDCPELLEEKCLIFRCIFRKFIGVQEEFCFPDSFAIMNVCILVCNGSIFCKDRCENRREEEKSNVYIPLFNMFANSSPSKSENISL